MIVMQHHQGFPLFPSFSGLKLSFVMLTLYRLNKLVETISRKPIPSHQKNLIFEVTAEDETGEDVEIPYVMVKLNE